MFLFLSGGPVKENNDNLKIAIYDSASIKSNNIVITELEQYIYPMLVRINSDYSLEMEVISKITKINNKEYELDLDSEFGITATLVKDTLDNIIKEKNKYYYKVENVDKVQLKGKNKIYITLKAEDEYFAYNLNIPVYKKIEKYGIYNISKSSSDTKLKLTRKESASKEYIKSITALKVKDEEQAMEMYKNGEIDAFFASSNNVTKMLGKYEYDLKAYNNGEGIFLMFNPKSKIVSQKYIRQIIAYSIDREEILKEVAKSNGKVKDLPYIYDENKYKYDVYAAENLLLTNGYTKKNLYYQKNGENLTLTLLVNKAEQQKVDIANKIKNDLLKVGINVIVKKAGANEIKNLEETDKYDLLLASIYINENPNINHLHKMINISDDIDSQIQFVNKENEADLSSQITNLKNVISNDIGIYGIYSKNNYIVCTKNVDLFKSINYMNLFSKYYSK